MEDGFWNLENQKKGGKLDENQPKIGGDPHLTPFAAGRVQSHTKHP